MTRSPSIPTRNQIESTKSKIQAEWSKDERCLRQLVAILKQRELVARLATFDNHVPASRAG